MTPPEPREGLDVVVRLEAALVALERSFAVLGGTDPLSAEEHRRLTRNLEALLEEVHQLADFLAGDNSDPETGVKPKKR